ncbi:hypothetical protein IFM89_025832 [Coptis chinensis]|uniref:Uncharacterized protein n=1 Tax=Coptis chinensis TaxID=261450 RepID=A0A835HK22_9MAGN|nr:hypothetical protein IFM89_025832 [Coptis chinensis]
MAVFDWAQSIASYVLYVLMTFLTDVWKERLKDAAAIVNMLDGLTAIMSVGIAILHDAYIGSYSIILISALAHITGLGFLALSVPPTLSKVLGTCHEQKAACIGKVQHSLFYMALPAIAVGRAGYENLASIFWNEQLIDPNNQKISNEKHCTNLDWINISLWIILLGTYLLSSIESWSVLYGILVVVMVIATIIFLSGTLSYKHVKPQGSPLACVVCVFVAATLKRHLQYPPNTFQLHNPEKVELPLPYTNRLRFLDKASLIVSPALNDNRSKWRLCTVTEVEESKVVLGMFPMWITFLMCGVVRSVGDTYFLEQGNNMENKLGKIRIPILSFFLLFEVSRVITIKIYSLILSSRTQLDQKSSYELRIGVGMLLSVKCCVVAALVETKRLNVLKNCGLQHTADTTVPMSVFWLMPQFLLLGAMDGLVKDGIKQFFYDNCPNSIKTYAEPLAKTAIGVGTILSIVIVTISNKASKIGRRHGWFSVKLNQSRLDYFYWTLACLSFVNLGFYFFVSNRFTSKRRTEEQTFRSNIVVPEQVTFVTVHPTVVPVHPDNMVIQR